MVKPLYLCLFIFSIHTFSVKPTKQHGQSMHNYGVQLPIINSPNFMQPPFIFTILLSDIFAVGVSISPISYILGPTYTFFFQYFHQHHHCIVIISSTTPAYVYTPTVTYKFLTHKHKNKRWINTLLPGTGKQKHQPSTLQIYFILYSSCISYL